MDIYERLMNKHEQRQNIEQGDPIFKDAIVELQKQQSEITTLRARVKELESGGWISVDTALPELRDDSVIAHFVNGSIETIHIDVVVK